MQYLFIIFSLLITIQVKASLIQFNSGDPVFASAINQNFNHLKNLLNNKQIVINFSNIQSGQETLSINSNFELLNNLGLGISDIPLLSGTMIRSSDLNQIFLNAENKISLYNNQDITIQAPYNQLYQTQINIEGLSPSASYILLSPAQKGLASISSNGTVSYTSPAQSFDYENDYFVIQASDSKYTIIKKIIVDINGNGIILNGTARTYYDGTIAKTCNEYFTQNNNKYIYSGNIGSGIYRIKPSTTVIDANCDMVNNGGGWTQISDSTPTITELAIWGDTSAISSTFNVNSSYGFNFGPTVDDSSWSSGLYKYEVPISHSAIRITYTGFYNSPSGGLGIMQIGNDISLNDYVYFVDPYTNDTRGQTLVVDGSTLFQADTSGGRTNITNRTDIVSAPSVQSKVSISMNGYVNLPYTYTYTKRYIRELWVK